MQLLTASTTVYRPSKPVRHEGRYEAAGTNSLGAFLGAGEDDERVDAAETEQPAADLVSRARGNWERTGAPAKHCPVVLWTGVQLDIVGQLEKHRNVQRVQFQFEANGCFGRLLNSSSDFSLLL